MNIFSIDFNTREEALILWVLLILVILFLKKSFRDPLINFLKQFTNKKIFIPTFLMLGFVAFVFCILKNLGLVESSMIKEVVFWLFGTGLIIFFNTNKALYYKSFFYKIIIDTFKLNVIIEYFTNFYTFPLIIEIVLLPVMSFLALSHHLSYQYEEYKPVRSFLSLILIIFGGGILFYSAWRFLLNISNFLTRENVAEFLIPIIFTLSIIPIVYLFALIMVYEDFFVRIEHFLKIKAHNNSRKIKFRIFFICLLNLRKIQRVSDYYTPQIVNLNENEDPYKILLKFKDYSTQEFTN